ASEATSETVSKATSETVSKTASEAAPEKERVTAGAAAATGTSDAGTAASGDTESGSNAADSGSGSGGKSSGGKSSGGKSSGGKSSGGKSSGGKNRAAQLARQQAAVDATRQKRLRDSDPGRFGLRRSVLAEAGVAVVLLAVTTVLTSTEPGRTEQDAAKANKSSASSASSSAADSTSGALTLDMSFDTGGTDGKGVVSVDLDPARAGANEMHIYVTRPNGRAFDVPEVKVAFTLEAKSIGPLPVTPDRITTGHWAATGVQIPLAGEWKIAVTVRTSDIDQVTVSKNAQIG
ncbi:copper transport protein, partial [Streptomyces sp. yr375]